VSRVTRRGILGASIVAALGTGGLAAAGIASRQDTSTHRDQAPAQLRGAAPLPYAQVIALDLADTCRRDSGLRAAHRAVAAIDGGEIAAWLALGVGILPRSVDRPRHLRHMPTFAGDVLDSEQSHGDLLLQITGASAHAARVAAEAVVRKLPQWQVRWRLEGARPENRAEGGQGLSRNPFHFTEGYGNPVTAAEMIERAIVSAGQSEPNWAVGGSYQVIRIIQLATDFWERDTVHEQERIVGRRRDGRWLDGTPAHERAALAADPRGRITPLDAHVRRAAPNPRSPAPMVRRGYNYRHSADSQGLVFSCFQRDLKKGFEAVQHRLQGEAMAKYALTVGGGYFFVPPPGDTWIHVLTQT